ncbi:MAG: succinate dehydrogenase cytochrome b subunit [Gemmatimonadales bacterium]|jgi:succinate dehydrogenase / fumarate reductase cytochrome b subunit|nr:MAG: succinate dehydrogenase cytochrome b subunit [Gemmatimonadales bacterium]
MGWALRFYRSTIGKKILMAVTGLIWVLFVIEHMAGNLLTLKSPEAINGYAALLKSSDEVLWTFRIGLFVALVVHVDSMLKLTARNWTSRRPRYAKVAHQTSSPAARTMRWGGVFLILWLVYHILHFTTGQVHPDFSHTDVYRNVTVAFQSGGKVALYGAAMVALALHLYHGAWSMFQTVGANHPHLEKPRRWLATAIAILIPLGFITVPLAIYFGIIG